MSGPPPVSLLRSTSDRADTFVKVKDWLKPLTQRGELDQTCSRLNAEHRHAVGHFLWQESQAGPRSGRARELLEPFAASKECASLDFELDWTVLAGLAASAPSAPLVLTALDRELAAPPPNSGLPPAESLLPGAKAPQSEVFQQLRSWVRQEKNAGHLAEVGSTIPAAYRACIFEFLRDFCGKRTVFVSQAREMLRRLAKIDSWCQGGAADRAALDELLEAWARDGDCFGADASPSAIDAAADAFLAPGPLIPSKADLEDPRADPKELLQQLCAWVEASSRADRLNFDAKNLDEEHQQALLRFLCGHHAARADSEGASAAVAAAIAPPAPQRPPAAIEKFASPSRRRWLFGGGGGDSTSTPKSSPTKAKAPPSPPKGMEERSPERYYVLQSLAKAGAWGPGDDIESAAAVDRSALSRALARMPPTLAA